MRESLFSRRTIRQGALSAVGSAKIKLLLSCCILCTLIALAGRTTTFLGWKQYAASLPRSSIPGGGFHDDWILAFVKEPNIKELYRLRGREALSKFWKGHPDDPDSQPWRHATASYRK
ncbi:hypothetical protein OROGR_015930 [Orobanche gracilis]